MSAFTDAKVPKKHTGLPCSVASALNAMDPDSVADLLADLAAPKGSKHRRSASEIAARINALNLGVFVGEQQLRRHRVRGCRCFDE